MAFFWVWSGLPPVLLPPPPLLYLCSNTASAKLAFSPFVSLRPRLAVAAAAAHCTTHTYITCLPSTNRLAFVIPLIITPRLCLDTLDCGSCFHSVLLPTSIHPSPCTPAPPSSVLSSLVVARPLQPAAIAPAVSVSCLPAFFCIPPEQTPPSARQDSLPASKIKIASAVHTYRAWFADGRSTLLPHAVRPSWLFY